jgi:hypothetical protein
MKGGQGWPWVAGSGVKGLHSATISGLKNGTYTVRLTFASPDSIQRVFKIALQGETVIDKCKPVEMTAQTETCSNVQVTDGSLSVKLTAIEGETILSGIEIIREGLTIGDVPVKP